MNTLSQKCQTLIDLRPSVPPNLMTASALLEPHRARADLFLLSSSCSTLFRPSLLHNNFTLCDISSCLVDRP